MEKGILSVKIMIVGAVLFLYGCEVREWDSAVPLLTIAAGLVLLLAGLVMGGRDKKGARPEL